MKYHRPVIAVLISIILFSPISHNIGIKGAYILLLLILFLLIHHNNINIKPILLIFFSLLLSSLPFFYWGAFDIRVVFLPLFFFIPLLYLYNFKLSEIKYYVDLSTILLIIMLIGAWIGFFYNYFGGKPILTLDLATGENNYIELYLTTFTKTSYRAELAGIIRPSGIYDEPGTFSFVICTICILRHLTGRNKLITWLILISGFITFSVAHLIYTAFHLSSEKINWKIFKKVLIPTIIFFSIFTLSSEGLKDSFNILFIERFKYDETAGRFIGDNRMEEFINAVNELDNNTFLWGKDSVCFFDIDEFRRKYGKLDTNPIWPLLQHGIFISWIYYVVLFILLIVGITKKVNLVYIGLFMLLLQRPMLINLFYSFFIILPILHYYKLHRNGQKKFY